MVVWLAMEHTGYETSIAVGTRSANLSEEQLPSNNRINPPAGRARAVPSSLPWPAAGYAERSADMSFALGGGT